MKIIALLLLGLIAGMHLLVVFSQKRKNKQKDTAPRCRRAIINRHA